MEDEVKRNVLRILVEVVNVEEGKVKLDSHIVNDLGADSLDKVEVISNVENEFGIKIPDEVAEQMNYPIDIVRYIMKQKTGEET